jgi:hypothetical protein
VGQNRFELPHFEVYERFKKTTVVKLTQPADL